MSNLPQEANQKLTKEKDCHYFAEPPFRSTLSLQDVKMQEAADLKVPGVLGS